MSRRWCLAHALVLIVGLGSLSALAAASPPDPTWLAGIYDGADYDDVVVTILAFDGFAGDGPPSVGAPALRVARMAPLHVLARPSVQRPAPATRAPPHS